MLVLLFDFDRNITNHKYHIYLLLAECKLKWNYVANVFYLNSMLFTCENNDFQA